MLRSEYTYDNPTYTTNSANQQQQEQQEYFSAESKKKGMEPLRTSSNN